MEPFKFKQFSVRHHRSSMKVGVDAVLIGAWAGKDPDSVLDVGTGCGVISLILAQRFPHSRILAIDIDHPSVEEAKENFADSPWSENLKAALQGFPFGLEEVKERYDLIVSNPPYFKSGIDNPITPREKARHQGSLSIFGLIEESDKYLKQQGRLALIFPTEFYDKALEVAASSSMEIIRECWVRDNPSRPEKRVMVEFIKNNSYKNYECVSEHLTLFEDLNPSSAYRSLCSALYLKF